MWSVDVKGEGGGGWREYNLWGWKMSHRVLEFLYPYPVVKWGKLLGLKKLNGVEVQNKSLKGAQYNLAWLYIRNLFKFNNLFLMIFIQI